MSRLIDEITDDIIEISEEVSTEYEITFFTTLAVPYPIGKFTKRERIHRSSMEHLARRNCNSRWLRRYCE